MSSKHPEPGGDEQSPAAWSLAARLTAWYAGSASLLILGVAGILYWALVANLDREDDQLLMNKINILRRVLRDRPAEVAALTQEVEWQEVGQSHMTILVRVLDSTRQPIMESHGMSAELPITAFPTPAGLDAAGVHGQELDTPAGKTYRIVAVQAAAGASATATHELQLAIDGGYEERLLADYRFSLLLVVSGSIVVCAGVSYLIARRGLLPLGRMDAAAQRIRSATLNERLAVKGLPAELLTLGRTFNAMLDRLERSFQQLSRFSADIAHELRTPVNNLRGEAEVALGGGRSPEEYRETLSSVLEECGRLARLIDSLLFLARAESPEAEIVKEPIDLRREIEVVCELYGAAAEEAGVAISVQAPSGLIASLDRGLFQRAIGNLVANALAHTPRGGRLTIAAARTGNAFQIDVQDTGSGIAPEHLPHVFDRFYRADPARTTSSTRVGLGLALVKRIIELHQGTAAISSEVGKGTCLHLRLPCR